MRVELRICSTICGTPVVGGSVDTTASSNFDAVAPAGGKVVDDDDAPGFYNKPRIISYPNLDDTIDKALTPDSYINFLRHLSKKCKSMKKVVRKYTNAQLELLAKTTEGYNLIKSKMRGECKKYVDDANRDVLKDINRRRTSALKRLNKIGEKVFKKDHPNRIKRFSIKAKTDPSLLNKPHNAFIGVYITFGERMSPFLSLKSGQHILIAHYGVAPPEDSNLYLKLRPNKKKKRLTSVLFIPILYLQK